MLLSKAIDSQTTIKKYQEAKENFSIAKNQYFILISENKFAQALLSLQEMMKHLTEGIECAQRIPEYQGYLSKFQDKLKSYKIDEGNLSKLIKTLEIFKATQKHYEMNIDILEFHKMKLWASSRLEIFEKAAELKKLLTNQDTLTKQLSRLQTDLINLTPLQKNVTVIQEQYQNLQLSPDMPKQQQVDYYREKTYLAERYMQMLQIVSSTLLSRQTKVKLLDKIQKIKKLISNLSAKAKELETIISEAASSAIHTSTQSNPKKPDYPAPRPPSFNDLFT